MNLEFLDAGFPVESGNFEIASEEFAKFRKYCELLGKKPNDLTEEELANFTNEPPFIKDFIPIFQRGYKNCQYEDFMKNAVICQFEQTLILIKN